MEPCSISRTRFTSWPSARPTQPANPKAEICAFKGQTLRIECTLVEDNRPEVGKALVDKMPVLKPALGEKGEHGVMYYLKDAKADFFKMMELVETVTF